MSQPKTFGELVRRDRELLGLTQEQLATRLSKTKDHPRDPYTKKPKKAARSWIAKLESGRLRRGLRIEVRQWLARHLKGDFELYESLPVVDVNATSIPEDFDVLPLLKHLATSKKDTLAFQELIRLCEAYRRCSEIGVSLLDPLTPVGE